MKHLRDIPNPLVSIVLGAVVTGAVAERLAVGRFLLFALLGFIVYMLVELDKKIDRMGPSDGDKAEAEDPNKPSGGDVQ